MNRTSDPKLWTAVASSSDGNKVVAAAASMIFTSADSGVTWTNRTSTAGLKWTSVASSADGAKVVASTRDGTIYTSADSGATWTLQRGAVTFSDPRNPTESGFVASSSDGSKLVSVVAGLQSTGSISTSIDSGVTWTNQTSDPNAFWTAVASSADGTKLFATAWGSWGASVANGIFASVNGGATWNKTSAPSAFWDSVATSSDGSKVIATTAYIETYPVLRKGDLYTSADGGATWNIQTVDP